MPSRTEIANQAYAHLGKGTFIANLETDSSVEARLAKLFYEPAVKATLRDFHWPFAGKIDSLQLVKMNPNLEWTYSYKYPSDCVDVRRILSGIRNDTLHSRVPYLIFGEESGTVIFTDKQAAQAEYTRLVTNAALFPADFELTLSYRWAAYMAPKITGGDSSRIGDSVMTKYLQQLGIAKKNAGNENQRDPEPMPTSVSSRGTNLRGRFFHGS